MKCNGFFIYKLPRACIKRARYCGNGGTLLSFWYNVKESLLHVTVMENPSHKLKVYESYDTHHMSNAKQSFREFS